MQPLPGGRPPRGALLPARGARGVASRELARLTRPRAQVFLARQWDAGLSPLLSSSLPVSSTGCSVHLADALSWLATCETRLGRAAEAEAHHKAAAKAVEACGLLESSNRTLHLLQQLRASKSFQRHKTLLGAWALSILHAQQQQRAAAAAAARTDAEDDVASYSAATSSQSVPGASGGAFALVGSECELDLLQAAVAMLNERLLCYHARGKLTKGACLASGPTLALCMRLETFGLRGRPGMPGTPLPVLQAWNAAELSAQMWAQAGHAQPAAAALRLRVALQATAAGFDESFDAWEGDAFPGDALDARALAISDGWKQGLSCIEADAARATAGEVSWLPSSVLKTLSCRAESIIAQADGWRVSASSIPMAAGGADQQSLPSDEQQVADALSLALLPLASSLMGADKRTAPQAQRVARAAARLCGMAGHVSNQAEALHLLGAAAYHTGGGRDSVIAAREAFAACLDCKRQIGADGGERAQQPAATAADAQASAGLVETLLFYGKVCWESGRGETAEEAHLKALAVGRARLGDGHPVAKKALAAMLDLKQKQRGGGSSP